MSFDQNAAEFYGQSFILCYIINILGLFFSRSWTSLLLLEKTTHFTQRNPRTFIKKVLKFSINISLLCLLMFNSRLGGVRLLKASNSRDLYAWSMLDSRISLTSWWYWSLWQQMRQNNAELAVSNKSMLKFSSSNILNTI